MESIASPHGIVLVSELHRLNVNDQPLRKAIGRGELVRVHRGAYVVAKEWESLNRRERYRKQVIAAALASRSRPVLSHQSAAAIWGIPTIGDTRGIVHVLTTISAGTRTENGFRRHAADVGEDDVVERDGVLVTSLHRTLIDLARDTPFASAVAGLDWSVRSSSSDSPPLTTIVALQVYFDQFPSPRNRRRVHRALEFSSPLAGSPGESMSRAVIHELGFAVPVLQLEVTDRRGLAGIADFGWPEHSLLGEFDGLVKYTRNMTRPGENIDAIVVREKIREDRMRATGRGMTRWLWKDALQPALLDQQLSEAGVPRQRRSGPVPFKSGR